MITQSLLLYCEEQILTRYESYDRGHNREHIDQVVRGVLELAPSYDVNIDMLYAAAVYHDLGVVEGRETHHLTSARMLREDKFIADFFSVEEIELIAEAIEDHRASSKSEPRSIYGKVLSSADRIIDPDTIIRRTYFYGLKHYPGLTIEEYLERIYNHMMEKYAEGGYMKVPILTSKNKEGLDRLRSLASDRDSFKEYCRVLIEKL